MKIAYIIVRSLEGLMFLFASVTFLFNLIPAPTDLAGDIKLFHDGMIASHYMFTTIKVIELVCSLCFLTGRFVPLATVVLFPIMVNILLYHSFVDPATFPVAAVLMAGILFMAYYNRKSYAPLFESR